MAKMCGKTGFYYIGFSFSFFSMLRVEMTDRLYDSQVSSNHWKRLMTPKVVDGFYNENRLKVSVNIKTIPMAFQQLSSVLPG